MSGARDAWPAWCCSYCAAPLTPQPHGLLCEAEERYFATRGGVHRLLPEDRLLEAEAFATRRRERLRQAAAGDGGTLPPEWEPGLRLASRQLGPGPWRVLEVGAGSCRASLDLLERGHLPAAVDVDLDPDHGLTAAERRLPPGASLPRAQAEWDALPLEPGGADLVVAVRALHHVPLTRLLIELRRVTRKGGALLCVGSPVRPEGEVGGALPRERLGPLFEEAGWVLHAHRPPLAVRRLLAPRRPHDLRPILLARRHG